MNYGLTLLAGHHYPEAVEQMNKLVERDPSWPPAHFYLSQVYASMERYPEAVRELQKSTPAKGTWSPDAQGYLKLMMDPTQPSPPANLAVTYAIAGDRNKAFEYLEKSYAEEDTELMAVIRFPAFESLHGDPRWADLLRRLDLPK